MNVLHISTFSIKMSIYVLCSIPAVNQNICLFGDTRDVANTSTMCSVCVYTHVCLCEEERESVSHVMLGAGKHPIDCTALMLILKMEVQYEAAPLLNVLVTWSRILGTKLRLA